MYLRDLIEMLKRHLNVDKVSFINYLIRVCVCVCTCNILSEDKFLNFNEVLNNLI